MKKIRNSLKILLPFLLWLFLFKDFLTGKSLILHDTFELYANIKLFLNSLQSGTYPLWDPYQFWGTPFELRLLQFGEFNPFLLLIIVFNACGMHFFHAFMTFLMSYYLVGLLGFYFLARRIWNDDLLAYVAYLFVLFSSLGMTIFSQIQMLFIFVPAVWFFYFVVTFCKTWRSADLLGITFSLMIILTTYVPFYFFMVLVLFLLFFVVIYRQETKEILKLSCRYFQKKTWITLLCGIAFVVSCIVPILVYRGSLGDDCVIPSRHADQARTLNQSMKMSYDEIKGGGIGARMSFDDLFSGLAESDFRNDGFVYLPVFVFIILLLSILTRLSRLALLLLCTGFILFFISLAEATPIHRFLFDHIFFFSLFRNIYFFLPLLISIIVLYVVEQFRLLSTNQGHWAKGAGMWPVTVIVLHGAFFIFLVRQENVLLSAYLTVLASLIFFLCLRFGLKCFNKVMGFYLAGLILLQPCEALFYYNKNAATYHSGIVAKSLKQNTVQPHFSFIRPEQFAKDFENGNRERDPKFFINWYDIAMEDSPGFITYHHGYPARWSYLLSQDIPEDNYRDYVKHKFVLYDQIEGPKSNEAEAIRFNGKINVATVVGVDERTIKESNGAGEAPVVIDRDSDQLHVQTFNANTVTVKTNLKTKKFLVYNDSFHHAWEADINGVKTKLYRANGAFKGVWVPEGVHYVRFSYRPNGGEGIYIFVFVFFNLFFAITIYAYFRKERMHSTHA